MSMDKKQEVFRDSDEGVSDKVDLVIVWHEKISANLFANIFKNIRRKKVDIYYDSKVFLNEFKKYPKNTAICLNTEPEDVKTGIDIAKVIYPEGYYNIYLLTGSSPEYLKKIGTPDYLQILSTNDFSKAVDTLLEDKFGSVK